MAYPNTISDASSFYANAPTVSFQIQVDIGSTSNNDVLEIKNISNDATILSFNLTWSTTGHQTKTITLTSAQRTTLLNAMGNVARFQVQYYYTSYNNGTVIGTDYLYNYIYQSSADDPVINSVSYADTNATTVAVTGNDQIMIYGKSNLVFTITATAQTGYSISSYNVRQEGGYNVTNNSGTVDMGVFRGGSAGSARFTVTVTDSGGRSTIQDVFVSYYSYSTRPVLVTYSVKRNASDSTKVDISFTGRYANIGTNTVTAKYKYKVVGSGSYSAETSLTLTVGSGTFSCSATTGSVFAEDNSYEFVLLLADKLETNNIYFTIPSVVPLVTFRPEAVGIGGEPTHTEALDVADGYSLNANGIQNTAKVMPYSFRTNGGSATAGWARIARIIFVTPPSGSDFKPVIEFTIQRYALGTTHMKLMFSGTNIISDTIEPTANNASGFPTITPNSSTSYNERVSTDPYTYDIYFPKANANDVLTVYTYCDASFQDMIKIEYTDNLVTTLPPNSQTGIRYFRLAPLQVVPVAARMGLGWNGTDAVNNYTPASHTLTLAPDWSIVDYGNITVDGKNNAFAYMPYSFNTTYSSGNTGYLRIAQITVTGTYPTSGICFAVQRLIDMKPIMLYVRFANENTTDPSTCELKFDDINGTYVTSPFVAFAYKEATSVWGIYVYKVSATDSISVTTYVTPYMQARCNITYSEARLASVPSGVQTALPISEWKYIHSASPGNITLINCTGTVATSYFRMWEKNNRLEYSLEARWRIADFSRTGAMPGFSFPTNARPQAAMYGYFGMRSDGNSSKTVVPEPLQLTLATDGTMTVRGMETYWNCVTGGYIYFMIPRTNFAFDY